MRHVDIFTTNDTHTLVYGGHWQIIPNTSEEAIAHGIASIMAELWAQEGDDAVAMMRINAPQILAELEIDEGLVDSMIAIAEEKMQ